MELATLIGHEGPIFGIAYSPDGRLLATGGADGVVRLWDVSDAASVRLVRELIHPNPGGVNMVVFSPDGRRMATSSLDETIQVYVLPVEDLVDLARSRLTRTLTEAECRQYLHLEACPAGP